MQTKIITRVSLCEMAGLLGVNDAEMQCFPCKEELRKIISKYRAGSEDKESTLGALKLLKENCQRNVDLDTIYSTGMQNLIESIRRD